uniref:Uncharacterized protein n=1 Tax=Sinocyclocheilus grahami TaxID=75366 RepID=A0A672KXK5_SINGR
FCAPGSQITLWTDELVCAVCLDLPKEPVSIQCGHSYCMNCITDFWDLEDQKRVYSCPQCRQSFSQRPALAKNTMLAEVVEKLKKTKLSADCYAGAGDVQCDVCTGRKYKAVRSCLMCLNSYCQNHLEQHERKRHNLTEATGRLQEMICHEHDKHLEMYCITDQRCICVLCAKYEHENHNTVSAAAQRTEKQDSERICTELIRSIESSRSEVTQMIRDQEKTAVSRAEGRLERLEQEINDLRRRDAELEQLSHTQDHIQLRVDLSRFCCGLGFAACSFLSRFNTFLRLSKVKIIPFSYLRHSRRLSLDPNTVNEYLRLSESNSVITYTYTEQPYPDHPDRFDVFQVLCRESVCGRCYWEIEWSGSVLISVSYKSLSTKGLGNESVFGYNDQSWSLSCSPSRCSFIHNNIVTKLPAVSSSRIGVFVDLSAGTLSFYSVSDTMSLIHTVQTAFTQTLYPGFLVDYGSSVKLC